MVIMTILIAAFVILAALALVGAYKSSTVSSEDNYFAGAFVSIVIAIMLGVCTLCSWADAKENKALIKAHLENPTCYTYTQLAEHNELVTKHKVWQGTIFSFYNDVDLQAINIDNVSQKVIMDSKEK